MRLPPPSVIATWPEPNYVDPITRGPAVVVVNIVFMTLVSIAVAGRVYSRVYVKKWFGIDDILAIPAYIFTVCLTGVIIHAAEKCGWNRHLWDIEPDMIQPANISGFIAKIAFALAATFTRLSMTAFYYRLIKDTGNKRFKWMLHASVAFIIATCITFLVLIISLCSPPKAYWVFPPIEHAHCGTEGPISLWIGIFNSIEDLLVVLLPIPIVMRLQLPLRQRIGVCVLLCIGMIVTFAGAVRTYYTWKSLISSWDVTWYTYPLWIAAAAELHLGMFCLCVPSWRPLLQGPLKKLSSKISSIRSQNPPPESKRNVPKPVHSVHQFQHTRLAFERTVQDPNDYELHKIERRDWVEPDKKTTNDGRDYGARGFRYSDVVLMEHPAPLAWSTPRDMMRRSTNQRSARSESTSSVLSSWVLQGSPTRPYTNRTEREFI